MWRTIIISSGEKITVKDSWLIVKASNNEVKVPISDIYALVIENRAASISVSTITSLNNQGAHIIYCNEQHIPSAISLPLNNHYRPYNVLKKQLAMDKNFKDYIWQKIIMQKICNQALCLKYVGVKKDKVDDLFALSKNVKCGDSSNREAVASKKYFTYLFGSTFRRSDNEITNHALNYGYSIIRSCVAKTLCAYGFNGTLGLHHINESNPFNLADDIMEPLRPIVDLWVDNNEMDLFETLTYMNRKSLINLVNCEILIGGKVMRVQNAIDVYVKSFSSCIESNDVQLLVLPELLKENYIYIENE